MCLDNNHIIYMTWADMSTSKVCPKCYHKTKHFFTFANVLCRQSTRHIKSIFALFLLTENLAIFMNMKG